VKRKDRFGEKLAFVERIASDHWAASGIGRATVRHFGEGAAVAGLDLNPAISALTDGSAFLGLPSDVTTKGGSPCMNRTLQRFGGN